MPPEQLAYKNWFVKQIVQNLENYSEADCEGKTPLVVSGEDNLIILRVSLDEWIKLYSSVMTGADFCYPETSDSVRWILNRAVECPVNICEVVASAIETCQDVRDAIAGAILADDGIRRAIDDVPVVGAPMGTGELQTELMAEGCDKDVIFAQIRGLVDALDTNNRDFLEIMSAASTPGKRLAQVLSAIPVIETLPIDDIVNYVSKMYDEIVTNYNAQWTTALRDEYSCDLFCLAQSRPDCQLDYEDVFEYFNERLGNAVSVENLVGSVVQYTILGTWSGSTVVDIMMLNQVAIWRAASNWLGVNLRTIQSVLLLASNIPDSDWEILCTECPPPPSGDCVDFGIEQGDWLPTSSATVRVADHGWWNPAGNAGIEIVLPEWGDAINAVQIIYDRAWLNDDDYERYFITVSDYLGGNPVTLPIPGNPLISDEDLIVEAPGGTPWNSLRIQVTAGGFTWPTMPPQYLRQVCINPDI